MCPVPRAPLPSSQVKFGLLNFVTFELFFREDHSEDLSIVDVEYEHGRWGTGNGARGTIFDQFITLDDVIRKGFAFREKPAGYEPLSPSRPVHLSHLD